MTAAYSHSLHWFRNDLRLADNPALHHACESSRQVTAVYLLTPNQWPFHHLSPGRIAFTIEALLSLQRELAGLGIALHVEEASTFRQVPRLLMEFAREHEVDQLCFNREYGLDECRRDRSVIEHCGEQNIAVHHCDGSIVIPPGAVTTQQGSPYKVFTPFKRAWLNEQDRFTRAPLPTPPAMGDAFEVAPSNLLQHYRHDFPPTEHFPANEEAASKRLRYFVDELLPDYTEQRDLPSVDGTSCLSPYLTAGVLSPQQCLHAARSAEADNPKGAQTWISELIWREFYLHLMHAFPDICRHKPLKPETDRVPWRYDPEDFSRWCEGQTGFPLVDAAMVQLNSGGWMHNRLRIVTATFLSKYLLLDWRWGEAYFMERLVDGHFASNNGGWQWCASTGTDAAPYFRILSPVRQAQRFDPDATFIKTMLPKLAQLPAKIIHQPGHPDLLATGYPEPIVDLKEAKQRCLQAFEFANERS